MNKICFPLSVIIPSRNEPSAAMVKQAIYAIAPLAEVVIIKDTDGRGKGWAIREGIKQTHHKIIVFIDGDFDILPDEILNMIGLINYSDAVFAIKFLDNVPPQRKIISIGYRILIKLLFGLSVPDTQTGLKIWKRSAIPDFVTNGFAFDLEMFLKAHKQGAKIKLYPICVNINKKATGSAIWKTLKEVLILWSVLSFPSVVKIYKGLLHLLNPVHTKT